MALKDIAVNHMNDLRFFKCCLPFQIHDVVSPTWGPLKRVQGVAVPKHLPVIYCNIFCSICCFVRKTCLQQYLVGFY